MKKFGSSDSSVSLMSAYSSGELQAMLCGIDEEESARIAEKKRRLRENQVKMLEKNFEVDNKLQPERKLKLANELGLQPRQIAVWFQNRRARWKTKQLEREYLVLKSNYDAVKLNRENLLRENESLVREIQEMKSKLGERHDCGGFNTVKLNDEIVQKLEVSAEGTMDVKDGSSDSDASAVLQEENGSYVVSSVDFVDSSSTTSRRFDSSCSPMDIFQFSQREYVPEFMKEERYFIGGEDCYNFFSGEQSATMPWFDSDQWK